MCCRWLAETVVAYLPSSQHPTDKLLRLNAPPTVAARLFCEAYPDIKKRWVLKQLQQENFKALTARLCMRELHLKFKGRMKELEEVVQCIAEWELPATQPLSIPGTALLQLLHAAVTFLTRGYKSHLAQSDDGAEQDHVGCATHCVTYMLSVAASGEAEPTSKTGPFCSDCAHAHEMTCSECNLASQLLSECKLHVQARRLINEVRLVRQGTEQNTQDVQYSFPITLQVKGGFRGSAHD